MTERIEEFYRVFRLQPIIRKGETYMNMDCRVTSAVAEADIMPAITPERERRIREVIMKHPLNVSHKISFGYDDEYDNYVARCEMHYKPNVTSVEMWFDDTEMLALIGLATSLAPELGEEFIEMIQEVMGC